MSEDNLAPLVTQCPNCTTRFKVTESQLQVASGRVRCGACLTVFEGTAHLLVDGELLQADGRDEVDALLDELSDELSQPPEAAGEVAQATGSTELPELSGADMTPQVVDSEEIDEADLPDDLAALEAELLADLHGAQQAESQGAAAPDPLEDDSTEADESVDQTDEVSILQPGATPASDDDMTLLDDFKEPDNSWVESAAEDLWADDDATLTDAETVGTGPGKDQKSTEETGKETEKETGKETEQDALPGTTSSEADAVVPATASEDHSPAKQPEVQEPREPAPHGVEEVELTLAEPQPPGPVVTADTGNVASARPPEESYQVELDEVATPRRPWLTWVLIGLAFVGLPAQVLWFQYESWVTDLTFRPVYQVMCNVAGCELPPMRDTRLIESRKSVSRSHPQQPDMRVVDLLIVNKADFAQAFPVVQVSFSALDGQLVASRRFQPAEYLRGDMAKVQLMPPRTPIHVSLELPDPGADAQSFRIQFH